MHKIFLGFNLLGTRKSLAPSGLEEVKIGVWYSKNLILTFQILCNEITF